MLRQFLAMVMGLDNGHKVERSHPPSAREGGGVSCGVHGGHAVAVLAGRHPPGAT